jgi:hypothetical protein
VDLLGEVALQFGGAEQGNPGLFGAAGVVVVAVDELVEDQVPPRVIAEVGSADEFVEVAAVVVEVPSHPELAFAREEDDLLMAEGFHAVLVGGRTERLDHLICAGIHMGSVLVERGVFVNARALSDARRRAVVTASLT